MKTRIQTIVLAASVVLGLVPLDASTSLPGQNQVQSTPPAFGAGFIVHESRIESQNGVELPSVGEVPAEAALASAQVPVPTRSSFMASWDSVSGATGYRLDVSTSSLFTSYVDGYHDLDVGNSTGRVVTGLDPGATYYYRARAYNATGAGRYSDVMTVTTVATAGLNIHAIFDSSITGNPNAAAIEAMINRAISIYESLFSDPITVQILFRYSTTTPGGTPPPPGSAGSSLILVYDTEISWSAFISALRADAKTSNDNLANASLPGAELAPNIGPSSANGRAVGLNTPPQPYPPGTHGAPYDGIITLNSARPLQFTRPVSANSIDAQSITEHEIDEVLGLGSHLNFPGTDVRPQELFSWSSAGIRNLTSSGTRYFSINGGVTTIINFNQNPIGDFGDWLSTSCPQAHPYVQNAIGCVGQSPDIAATSPEGTNLDVIGYDLNRNPIPTPPTDFNNDSHPDYVLFNTATHATWIWYMNNNVRIGNAAGPTIWGGWSLASVADFNRDNHPDYLLFNSATRSTWIWYMNNNVRIGNASGPTLPVGRTVVALGDFNSDGYPDYLLFNANTGGTAVWYMRNNVRIGSASGPTLPVGRSVAAVADFNGDTHPDYLLFNASTRSTLIWYMSGVTRTGSRNGPTIPAGVEVAGLADFDGNGRPDYLLYNSSTRHTAIWYLNNYQLIRTAAGPTIWAGWSVVAP